MEPQAGPATDAPDAEAMTFARRKPWPGLASLFAGEAFRFRFQLRPARAGWLASRTGDPAVLEDRGRRLATPRALVWTPAADATWERVEERLDPELRLRAHGERSARDRARVISGAWAPDVVLLRPMGEELRMVGGAVCFPSGWDPMAKLGGTVAFIHGPVPGLNDELGARIARFLGGLRAGDAFERDNWGVAATGRLDMHPADDLPRIEGGDGGDAPVWLRLEEQAFVGLGDGHVLFLIHVRTWPLDEVLRATGAREAFGRMVASMPADVARYKGMEGLRGRWLEAGSTGGVASPAGTIPLEGK